MNFASDNWGGALPEVAQALVNHCGGFAAAYGNSELDRSLVHRFQEIFEHDLAMFLVGTGTAANSLAMSAAGRPGGVVFSHANAHMFEEECGAIEKIGGGLRITPVEGALGKIDPEKLAAALGRLPEGFVHVGQPSAVTLTQATEWGTLYQPDEIAEIASIARKRNLAVHMDGARFANALVALDVTPADMTWRQGIDMLSFGASKNGCWCAEALLVFNPRYAEHMIYAQKQAGHLFSKSRFISAQLEAYLSEDNWRQWARQANGLAAELTAILMRSGAARIAWTPEANIVFAIMKIEDAERFQAAGAFFYRRASLETEIAIAGDEGLYRFVTSPMNDATDLRDFAEILS
jgi:threonine aldolase